MSKLLMQSLRELRVVDTVMKKVEPLNVAGFGSKGRSVYDFVFSSSANCIFMVDSGFKISWYCLQHGESGRLEDGNIVGLTISNDGRLIYGLDSSGIIIVDAFSKKISDKIELDFSVSDDNATIGNTSMNVSPNGKLLYILKHSLIGNGSLYEVDLEKKRMARSMLIYHGPVENIFFPHRTEISDDGKTLFMLKPDESIVGFIDLENFKEAYNVRVHNEAARQFLRYDPQCLALNADGTKLYVACYKDKVNKVSVIDTLNKKVLKLLTTTSKPRALSVNKKNGALYVACQDGVLMVFDTTNDGLINMLPQFALLDHVGHMGIIDTDGMLEVDLVLEGMDIDRLPPAPDLVFDDEALLRVTRVVDKRLPVEKIQDRVHISLRQLKIDTSTWEQGVPEYYILKLQSMSRDALYLATATLLLGNTGQALTWFKMASTFDEIGLTYQRKRISTWYDESVYCRDALYHAILSKDQDMIGRIANLTFHIDDNWPKKFPDCAYFYHYIQALASLAIKEDKGVSQHIANMNVVKGRQYNKKKIAIKKRSLESIVIGDRGSFIISLNELLTWHNKTCMKRSPMAYDLFAYPEIALALVAKGIGIELKPEDIDVKLRPYIMWDLL